MRDLEPFQSSLLLLSGAMGDIGDLEVAVDDWVKDIKFDVIRRFNKESGEESIFFKIDNSISPVLRVSVSKIINDMRHSLDHAVGDAIIAMGSTPDRNSYFPFARTKSDFEGIIRGKYANYKTRFVECIWNSEPYEGGDDFLYKFNALVGSNKHARLISLSTDVNGSVLDGYHFNRIKGPARININQWNDDKSELLYATAGLSGCVDMKFFPVFILTLGDGAPPFDRRLTESLKDIHQKIDQIVSCLSSSVV